MGKTLTEREGQVIGLMAEGRSNAAIAARMFVSEGAVEKHVANIFAKLRHARVGQRQPTCPRRPALPRRLSFESMGELAIVPVEVLLAQRC